MFISAVLILGGSWAPVNIYTQFHDFCDTLIRIILLISKD